MKLNFYTRFAFSFLLFISLQQIAKSQNIFPSTGSAGIGTTTPDASSALEIKSTTQGILIPRMTKNQRDNIVSPAKGLMIYQTNFTPGFYYFDGSVWSAVSSKGANKSLGNLTSPTAVNVDLLPSADSAINIGDSTKSWNNFHLKGKVYFGDTLGMFDNAHDDFFAGPNAGHNFSSPLNGQRNTGIGKNALYYGGFSNTAVGWNSLETDSTGGYNAAVGALCLLNNETGNENAAVGNAALYRNIGGDLNTAMGSNALAGNADGSNNVAVGAYSLDFNLESANTAVGDHSLSACDFGYNNTAVGYHAGNTITSGTRNTLIGYGADVGGREMFNATAIGNLTVVGATNHIHIGNASITSIGGQVGWTSFSDERIKTNIKENVPGLAFINLLKPVTYNFNIDKQQEIMGRKDSSNYNEKYDINKIQFTGFLAQDVEIAAKKIGYNFSGIDAPKSSKEIYGLRYSDFVVPLVKAVQELSQKNDELGMINDKLKKQNDDLEQRVSKLEAMMNVQPTASIFYASFLKQNIPNPFSISTVISYSLPNNIASAKIIVTDKDGKALKEINISGNQNGSVKIDASTFSSGAYQYALYADGKLIDKKQMILAK